MLTTKAIDKNMEDTVEGVLSTLFDGDIRKYEKDGKVFFIVETVTSDPDVKDLLQKIERHDGVPMYLTDKDIQTIWKMARLCN